MYTKTELLKILDFFKFNCDISNWDVKNVLNMTNMFKDCQLALKPEFQCRK